MAHPDSKNKEFGLPPEEYPVRREDEQAVSREEHLPPADSLADEFPDPAPELVEPGAFPWKTGGRGKNEWRLMAFFASGVLVLALGLGRQREQTAGEPALPVPTAPPAVTAAVQSAAPAPTASAAAPEPTAEPTAEPTPEPWVTPSCDVVAISFASEMQGKITFENMDDVDVVTLQIWDPFTQSMDREIDITEEALTYGAYAIEPFTTDFIYEKHREAYEAAGSFPMEVEYRVIMSGAGGSVTCTQRSVEEDGWYVYYTPEGELWGTPGCFTFSTFGTRDPLTISFGEPELVREGVLDLVVIIDGRSLDPETFIVTSETGTAYRNDGTEEEVVFYTVTVPRPAGVPEGQSGVALFDVTQYLHHYGFSWTTEQKVGF